MEGTWRYSKIQQRLFGEIPDIDKFMELTKGIVEIRPRLHLVSPLSASSYPFEIYVEYESDSNGILVPIFRKRLKHYESIERITEEDYSEMNPESLNERFIQLGEHRKLRVKMRFERDAELILH
jgi:hypothetical protein